MAAEHLLLVGAGHAHLHLLTRADRLVRAGYRVTLVAPEAFDYSGAASAIAAGGRDPAYGRIELASVVTDDVGHVPSTVSGIDPACRTVTLADGTVLPWDVLCLNVGSVTAFPSGVAIDLDAPEVVAVKPLSDLHRLRDLLAAPTSGPGHRVSVIGAGPSGVELAAHLAARPETDRVHLLEGGSHVGGPLPPRAARRLLRLLRARGVTTRTGSRLHRIDRDATVLGDGSRIPHDVVVLATGLAPPPLAVSGDLGGPGGFPVRATLQHRDHGDVYATGDCAHFLPCPLPRVGVHGVRQGPVLLAALEARREGGPAPIYRPQRQVLAILDLGGGTALAVRGRWWWLGRASLALKRVIDRRWLRTYRC